MILRHNKSYINKINIIFYKFYSGTNSNTVSSGSQNNLIGGCVASPRLVYNIFTPPSGRLTACSPDA